MTTKEFSARFIVDEHFIQELLQDKVKAVGVLQKLSFIHSNSFHYPLEHNCMFDVSFCAAIHGKEIRGPALIGAMKPIPFPSFVQAETHFESKLIRTAIDMATRKPYKVFVLTSEAQAKVYAANSHYTSNGVKETIVLCWGEQARYMIDAVATI